MPVCSKIKNLKFKGILRDQFFELKIYIMSHVLLFAGKTFMSRRVSESISIMSLKLCCIIIIIIIVITNL